MSCYDSDRGGHMCHVMDGEMVKGLGMRTE